MNDIFFIADTHFSHSNIIRYCHRLPWLPEEYLKLYERYTAPDCTWDDVDAVRNYRLPQEYVDAHDDALVENWNAMVKPGDRVYHLGDFAWGYDGNIEDIRKRLNGQIYLVRGNHDKEVTKTFNCFQWIKDLFNLKVDDPDCEVFHGKRRIVLCHYAMRVWDNSHRGAWQLWGHSHGQLADDPKALSFDVGVDATAMRLAGDGEVKSEYYRPISYDEVKAVMSTKDWDEPDFVKGIKGPDK